MKRDVDPIFAECRRTAPVKDAEFFLEHGRLDDDIRAGVLGLLDKARARKAVARSLFYREFWGLVDRQRRLHYYQNRTHRHTEREVAA